MDIQSWYAKGTTFVSGDTSVFYVREGKGIPLVCIHGFPTSSWDFATVFFVLIPASQLSGGHEADVAMFKGTIEAIETAQAVKSCS